jgi:pimeloyl-ACP methyl ester carboxylesterase
MPVTAIVLLHPIGLDRASWQFVDVPDASAIDLPGHGGTRPLADMSLASLADYVCAQVDGVFHLVGLSMGGMIAQHVAVRHPNRLASLVIACASGTASRDVLGKRAAEVEQDGMQGVVEEYLVRWFSEPALADRAHRGVAYARERLLADDAHVIGACWRAMSMHDLLPSLDRISVPTTVIAGSADVSAPVSKMREVADRIPGARLRVADGPHMLHLEAPGALTEVLADHFRSAA